MREKVCRHYFVSSPHPACNYAPFVAKKKRILAFPPFFFATYPYISLLSQRHFKVDTHKNSGKVGTLLPYFLHCPKKKRLLYHRDWSIQKWIIMPH